MSRLRPHPAALPLYLGVGLLCTAGLNGQTNPPFNVTRMVEISIPTEPGKTYRLEKSTTLSNWLPDAKLFFGDGSTLAKYREPASGTEYFRIRVDTAPPIGPAPWTLEGRKLGLNSQGNVMGVSFHSSNAGSTRRSGAAADEPFTYTLRRSSAALLIATLDYGSGRTDLVELSFVSPQTGTFVVTQTPASAGAAVIAGTFAEVANIPPGPPAVPVSMDNYKLIASDGGTPEYLDLRSGGNGTQAEGSQVLSFTYAYSVQGANKAIVMMNLGNGKTDTYELTYTADGAGVFLRTQVRPGVPADQDTGAFSLGN